MLGKYSKTSNLIGNRIYDAQSYGFQTPKKSNSVTLFSDSVQEEKDVSYFTMPCSVHSNPFLEMIKGFVLYLKYFKANFMLPVVMTE